MTWRLIDVRSGRTHTIPSHGMVIGRNDECDLVFQSKGVSRRHAVIRHAGSGFTVTDESVNGTYVNDERVDHVQLLAHGDTLRIGDEELRVESDVRQTGAASDATVSIKKTERPTEILMPTIAPPSRGKGTPAKPVLGTLEVVRGEMSGSSFSITRPVCAIGRGEHNEVVLRHESVSSSHATLLLKGSTWYVVDLRSANGTFVDGYRVAGERVLPTGCTLRLGEIKLVFRPGAVREPAPIRTRRAGIFGRLVRMVSRW
jgi:pSer/pThr/pTyr-binding forkhead associated (FHA) protein